MKYWLVLFVVLLLTGTATAHQDLILELHGDGSLDLPPERQPARLDWSASKPALSLRVGNHETVLPICITTVLIARDAKIRIRASWRHDLSRMPPYIAADVVNREDRGEIADGYRILFNLDTGEVIKIESIGVASRGHLLNISSLCGEGELKGMVRAVPK